MNFPEGLSNKLNARRKDGTLRTLTTTEGLVDFFSNDYLGFARQSRIEYPDENEDRSILQNGSTGSRLISGNHQVHEDLEKDLSNFFKSEATLLFNSGYDANIGLLSSVPQRGDSIFYDRLSHASIRDGISLSKARSYGFEHNDLDDLNKKFRAAGSTSGQNYVVVESVYSMDGDEAPLVDLVSYCKSRNLYLIVDEAHSTGVFGEDGSGLITSLGLEDDLFARVHTFGKALGLHGAAVLGSESLRDYLLNFARSFIYTTALPPREAYRIQRSLLKLQETEERRKLRRNIEYFIEGMRTRNLSSHFLSSRSPIQSFLLPENSDIGQIRAKLNRDKIGAKLIFSPTVPQGEERIRICIHSFNTSSEIDRILHLLSTFV